MRESIRKLISETEHWLAEYQRRRRFAVTRGAKSDASIEAAACMIRLRALRQCLAIVEEATVEP